MQRIEVTDAGITVTLVTEPLMSMYGKAMRPGTTSVYAAPWDEVASVALSASEVPPDGRRRVELVVDLTYGEFFEIHEDDEGFADALRALCRLSGVPVPDTAALTAAGQVIWPV